MSAKASSKRPKDEPFRQQKLKAWQPILTPEKVVIAFLAIGIAFIPTGISLLSASNNIFESTIIYDGVNAESSECSITEQNEGRLCEVSFTLRDAVSGPLYLYYELGNFFQNHRRYVSSRDANQLMGLAVSPDALKQACDPMTYNGSLVLNPCGLIANSLFTDVISLNITGLNLDETDISWASDRKYKFLQPSQFQFQQVDNASSPCTLSGVPPSDCKSYYDAASGMHYKFYYPDDDKTQYLYESYPGIISPIKGVTDEHFIVWMRTAGLPTFRKLYGKVTSSTGGFDKGQTLTFTLLANYEISSFSGSKALVISTVGDFGGVNPYLGIGFIVVGILCLFFGFLFLVKYLLSPRELGDKKLLNWG